MTAIIHLDTSITDFSIQKLRSTAENMFDRADYLYSLLCQTEWQGASKDLLLYDLYRCSSTLKTLSDSLDLLGFQLSKEIEQWMDSAENLGR